MVMGYSEPQDRVILYQFYFRDPVTKAQVPPKAWLLRFAFRKPIESMHWRYEDWYNSGTHDELDFRYIPARERFEGTERYTLGR
jgi:hypothetical protein